MGMDCVARKHHETMSTNWTGWEYIGALLTSLACPMYEFKFKNDGGIVSEATARRYGEAIRDAVKEHRVFEIIVPDDDHAQGFNKKPIVLADSENWEKSLKENINAEKARDYDQVASTKSKTILKTEMTQRNGSVPNEIDDKTAEWLLEWSQFFINSGGFAQW